MNVNAGTMQLMRDSTFAKDSNRLTTALVRTKESARVFVFQQLSKSCREMTRDDHSFVIRFLIPANTRPTDWRMDKAGSPGTCREPAAFENLQGISIRFGAADACGHTAASLDLAGGLSLLG
jgi:hypothetical protein